MRSQWCTDGICFLLHTFSGKLNLAPVHSWGLSKPLAASTALHDAAGVTTEAALLHPENGIHPDFYMSQLSDLLSIKEAPVPA